MIEPHNANWLKSSRSANNGQCVEVASLGTVVGVRDSKLDTAGDFPILAVSNPEWSALLSSIHNGDLTS